MRLTRFELGWLIGLIEADGSITHDGQYPTMVIKMTDLDTVQRAATLIAAPVYGPYKHAGSLGDKPCYITKLVGARAVNFLSSTKQHFSIRRRVQIDQALGEQKSFRF